MNFLPKFLFILSSLLFIFSFGQNQPLVQDSVDIIPVWKINEIKSITFNTTTTDLVYNKKYVAKSQLDARFKILKADEQGYDVEWIYTKVLIPEKGDVLIQNNLLSKLVNQKFIIRISNEGRFLDLINAEEIQKKALTIAEELISKEKDERRKADYQIAKALITTKDGLKNNMLQPIGLYYFYFGNHAKLHQKQTNNVTLPNPFGGELFSGKEITEMTQLTPDHSSLTIETQKSTSGDQVKKAYMEIINKTKPDMRKQMTEPFKNSNFEVSEKKKYIIDLKNNTVTKGFFQIITKIGIHNRTLIWEIQTV